MGKGFVVGVGDEEDEVVGYVVVCLVGDVEEVEIGIEDEVIWFGVSVLVWRVVGIVYLVVFVIIGGVVICGSGVVDVFGVIVVGIGIFWRDGVLFGESFYDMMFGFFVGSG